MNYKQTTTFRNNFVKLQVLKNVVESCLSNITKSALLVVVEPNFKSAKISCVVCIISLLVFLCGVFSRKRRDGPNTAHTQRYYHEEGNDGENYSNYTRIT